MPRCLLGILIFLLASVSMARAQGDIALLRIGSETVSKEEFEFYFNRSSLESLERFLTDFVTYKAKVLYARECGLDTMPAFVAQKLYYAQMLKDTDSVSSGKDAGREWIRLKHVTKRLPQHLDKSEEQDAKMYMDSIYVELTNGTDMTDLGLEPVWMPRRYILAEWVEVLDRLKKGEYSKPFYSPIGIHVVCWEEKGCREHPATAVDRSVQRSEWKFSLQEMEESLLVAALEMSHKVSCTEDDLSAYFRKHRADYHWELPRYRGVVFHCKDKKSAKALKKYLKRYDARLWEEALNRMDTHLSEMCRYECGVFAIGKNKYVDRLVFKCGEFEPLEEYPYTFVMGKKQKKPESYRDVREEVLADCLKSQETSWESVVKQKYKVEINEEILKTVNNSGSNGILPYLR